MSDLNCTEALDSVRIRFKVLKQAKPGDIIVLDASGRWLLQPPSPWKSAVRKLFAFFSQTPMESHRQAFLKSAKESVKVMIHHCKLLMETQLFNKATDTTGVISVHSMQKLNSTEVNHLEVLLQSLQSFCTDLYEGLLGLNNVIKHQPYADDLTFCSEIQVSLVDPVRQFLDQIYRRMGVFGNKLLPFFPNLGSSNKSTSVTPSANAAAATGWHGFVFNPVNPPAPPPPPPPPQSSPTPPPSLNEKQNEPSDNATLTSLPRPLSVNNLHSSAVISPPNSNNSSSSSSSSSQSNNFYKAKSSK